MKPVLLSLTAFALITVAACNGGGETANSSASTNTAVPDAATGNVVGPVTAAMTPQQAYETRHERYEEMGDSLKAINRELKGTAPDVPRIQREAATLATLAGQIPQWFPAGSGPDVNLKSRAKAEIWTDSEGFRRSHEAYLNQAEGFNRIAQSGNVEAMRAAAGELGKSCGDCHKGYRGPER
jgi:cytochrome c556